MNTAKSLFSVCALLSPCISIAAELPDVDTSNWKCGYCQFEEPGFSGYLELGLGQVSDSSYKFGESSGMNEEGSFLIGEAALRYRDESTGYWNININNIGLDSRSINIEGGNQGSYKLHLNYSELPHFISDSSVSPFNLSGNNLVLPGSWVRAGSTGTMTDLANSLHSTPLETSRTRLGMGATVLTSGKWRYAVDFRNETREGQQALGGSFFFNSAQLIMPVDYETRQIDLSAAYTDKQLQARLAYYSSAFSNSNKSLNWDNPYTSAVAADSGQIALPPDNEFHQLSASIAYDISAHTRATADIAYGRMTQNDRFLDATVNSSLAGYPFNLPATSLDATVDTLNANLKLFTFLSDRLRMDFAYIYNDHDDKTPQASYTWVTTDSFVNPTTRSNTPYSYTQSKFKAEADYRFSVKTRLSAGFNNEKFDRSYQEVSQTTENTLWVYGKTRIKDNIQLSLKLEQADRDINNYEVLPWLETAENPLMHKYNMTDRSRTRGKFRVDFFRLGENMSAGLGFDFSSDDYDGSTVGLQESEDTTLSADINILLSKTTSAHAFFNRDEITSRMAGSSTATTPDWSGENDDVIDTIGIGIKHKMLDNKLSLGADYHLSKSAGKLSVDSGAAAAGFPDNTADLSRLKLYASYQVTDDLTVKGTYWYEKFDSENWSFDGVDPDTVSNLLSLGRDTANYDINVLLLSLHYRF